MLIRLNYVAQSGSRFDSTETTIPVMVNTENVRYFHPRKYGRQGTRLSMLNGSGLVVSDPFATVQRLFGVSEGDIVEFGNVQAPGLLLEGRTDSGEDANDNDVGEFGEDQ